MQDRPKRVTTNGDSERPNVARLIDYYLGGAHNFAVDRELAEESMGDFPVAEIVRSIRLFLRRVVRQCVEMGIRQFLDLGSGIPTGGNVHEVALQLDPTCRVVYVDHDPIAVAHSRTMLRDLAASATIVEADLREPARVMNHPETLRLIDFSKPTAVLFIGVLPYLHESDDPSAVIRGYRDRLQAGSLIALTHLTKDVEPELVEKLVGLAKSTGTTIVPRSKRDFEEFVAGMELLSPGMVLASQWRSDGELPGPSAAADAASYGAVGQIR